MITRNASKTVLDLIKQRSVNDVYASFLSLAADINKSLATKPRSEDAGASEISEFLGNIIYPLSNKLSDEDLYKYLVRSHIAYICCLHLVNVAFDNLREEKSKQAHDAEAKLKKNGEGIAVAENMRNMCIDILLKRRHGDDETNIMEKIGAILTPIEQTYAEFTLLLNEGTLKNKKKICALDINEVADTSRCIIFTEMKPINRLIETVSETYPDKQARNKFQRKLCNHMVQNVDSIVEAQNDIAEQAGTHNPFKQVYETLMSIKDVILSTKWTVGWMGGVAVSDKSGQLLNTVPHGMSKILAEINNGLKDCKNETADQAKRMLEAFTRVAKQATESAVKQPFSFFGIGKRDHKTQSHYDNLNKFIIEKAELDLSGVLQKNKI